MRLAAIARSSGYGEEIGADEIWFGQEGAIAENENAKNCCPESEISEEGWDCEEAQSFEGKVQPP